MTKKNFSGVKDRIREFAECDLNQVKTFLKKMKMNNDFKNTFNNNDGERPTINRFFAATLSKNSPFRQRPNNLFSSQNLK